MKELKNIQDIIDVVKQMDVSSPSVDVRTLISSLKKHEIDFLAATFKDLKNETEKIVFDLEQLSTVNCRLVTAIGMESIQKAPEDSIPNTARILSATIYRNIGNIIETQKMISSNCTIVIDIIEEIAFEEK